MEKKINIKCTVAYGDKSLKDLYKNIIKTKIKEQTK